MEDDLPDAASVFLDMAARIKRNEPSEFQGAYVILTPDKKVISHALIDSMPEPEGFWLLLNAALRRAQNERGE